MTRPDNPDEQLRLAVGQLLMVGFKGKHEPPPAIREALTEGRIGGVILFRRNVLPGPEGLPVLTNLNAALSACQPAGGPPPFIAVDQEGGRVVRVRDGMTPLPPMGSVGAANDLELTGQVGEVIAREIAALGFNLNFAPCLDLFTNPENTVIGDRAFGDDPESVARHAMAVAASHLRSHVIPCGKHFPGHGDTIADSHFELPVIAHDLARLRALEMIPFARAIDAGIPMIMTAHILAPELDPELPMTLSPFGITRLLRGELGFEGVVVTDDLEMNAIADRYEIEEVVSLGLAAGIDLFLICHTEARWRRAYDHLLKLGMSDEQTRQRVMASAARVRTLKSEHLPSSSFAAPEPERLSAQLKSLQHLAVVNAVPSDT